MSTPIDDYMRRLDAHLALPAADRPSVLAEIRAHLEAETSRLQADEGLAAAEAAAQAIEAFGEPSEIAVAYGDGAVVNKQSGQTLLHVAAITGRAAGRGARGLLKWTAIFAVAVLATGLVILAIAALLGVAVLGAFGDEISEAVPRPVYDDSGSWEAPAFQNGIEEASFQIGPRVKEFRIGIDTEVDSGCLAIQLVSPSGQVIETNGNGCDDTDHFSTYTEQGTWTIRYQFVAFTGSYDVDAWSFESAPGTTR